MFDFESNFGKLEYRLKTNQRAKFEMVESQAKSKSSHKVDSSNSRNIIRMNCNHGRLHHTHITARNMNARMKKGEGIIVPILRHSCKINFTLPEKRYVFLSN